MTESTDGYTHPYSSSREKRKKRKKVRHGGGVKKLNQKANKLLQEIRDTVCTPLYI